MKYLVLIIGLFLIGCGSAQPCSSPDLKKGTQLYKDLKCDQDKVEDKKEEPSKPTNESTDDEDDTALAQKDFNASRDNQKALAEADARHKVQMLDTKWYDFNGGQHVKVHQEGNKYDGCSGMIVDRAKVAGGPMYEISVTECPKPIDENFIKAGEEFITAN